MSLYVTSGLGEKTAQPLCNGSNGLLSMRKKAHAELQGMRMDVRGRSQDTPMTLTDNV